MNWGRLASNCFGILALCGAGLLPAREIPVEEFFKDFGYLDMKLSPDGARLAVLGPSKGRHNLAVIELATKTPRWVTGLNDADVYDFHWKGNRLIFRAHRDGFDTGGLFSVKDSGTSVDILVPTVKDQTRGLVTTAKAVFDILHPLPDAPEHILVEMEVFDQYSGGRRKRNGSVYRMNIYSGDSTLLEQNPGSIVTWTADQRGDIRAAVRMDGKRASLLWRAKAQGDWQTLEEFDVSTSGIWPTAFTDDNRNLLVAAAVNDDTSGLYLFDVDLKKVTTKLWDHDRYEADNALRDDYSGAIIGVGYLTDRHAQDFFAADLAKVAQAVNKALPQTVNRIVNWSRDRKKILFLCEADRSPGIFYLFDLATGRMEELGGRAEWFKWADMAPMRAIDFKARDGKSISGYLTLPSGVEPKRLSLVVLPHGGPWARDVWGFNTEVQFLANRGYAVLQVNFRGSTGYGQDFMAAGYKEFGGLIQRDITDGVRWAIAEGIADPQRIAIFGTSFGGYSAMWGLINEPELYRCGINLAGPTDLLAWLRGIDVNLPRRYAAVTDEMVGDTDADRDRLEAMSPVHHVAKIRAPVLMAFGEEDPIVHIAQGRRLASALKKADKEFEFIVERKEGHGFHIEENRIEFYRKVEAFLKKHLK